MCIISTEYLQVTLKLQTRVFAIGLSCRLNSTPKIEVQAPALLQHFVIYLAIFIKIVTVPELQKKRNFAIKD
jgi:hypothetical protein